MIIEQTYEICNTNGYSIEDIFKDVERAARISYKSEDKIKTGSAREMVERLINMKHYSPLEFGTVYMVMTDEDKQDEIFLKQFCHDRFTVVKDFQEGKIHKWYITTNYRVIVENHWEHIMNKYLQSPTKYHERRTTIKFTCPRIISQMFMRHRVFSFLQESQRYCNYTKDKFKHDIDFIRPVQGEDKNGVFKKSMLAAKDAYFDLIEQGWKPQEARAVLPNYTATSFYMCGFDKDWDEFFRKRDIPQADPQIYDIVHPLRTEFEEHKKKIANKDILPESHKSKLQDLIEYAKEHGEDRIAELANLAVQLNNKEEYSKFREVFS